MVQKAKLQAPGRKEGRERWLKRRKEGREQTQGTSAKESAQRPYIRDTLLLLKCITVKINCMSHMQMIAQ